MPGGVGLLGALSYYGLSAIDAVEKDEMRQLAIRGFPFTPEESRALMAYCYEDVTGLTKLLYAMTPNIDIGRALLRGRYMRAAASIERAGVPIDMNALNTLKENWGERLDTLIREMDAIISMMVELSKLNDGSGC